VPQDDRPGGFVDVCHLISIHRLHRIGRSACRTFSRRVILPSPNTSREGWRSRNTRVAPALGFRAAADRGGRDSHGRPTIGNVAESLRLATPSAALACPQIAANPAGARGAGRIGLASVRASWTGLGPSMAVSFPTGGRLTAASHSWEFPDHGCLRNRC
jgi:hypothetical protein